MIRYLALTGILAAVVLAGCVSSGSSRSLTGQLWALTELGGVAPLPDTNITAEFSEDGRVGGSSGCNSYTGPYTVDGENIEMGPFAGTLMACQELVMAQEILYLQSLEEATTYQISGDELTLKGPDGDDIAVFNVLDQSLEGSSWDVIAYNNGVEAVVSVIIGTEITANFGEDGQLNGNAGCNDYFAAYETDGENITIDTAGATEKLCAEPEGIMEQEQLYLAALETAATYKINGPDMEMRTGDGARVASFERAPTP